MDAHGVPDVYRDALANRRQEFQTPTQVQPPPDLHENVAETEEAPKQVLTTVETSFGKLVPIYRLYWSMIKPDYLVSIEGRRRSGKTNFMRNLLKSQRRFFPEVYIITTTKISEEYSGLVPDKYIIDNLDTRDNDDPRGPGGLDILLILWRRQLQRKVQMKQRGKNDENIQILVVLEDCVANDQSTRGFHNMAILNKIALNGRHAHLSLWVTSQNIKAMPPAIKDNTDFAFIQTATSKRTKETIRESFVDNLANDQELDEVFAPLQKTPWSTFALDRSNPRIPTTETIFMCVTEKLKKDFVLGSRDFWRGYEYELIKNGFGHLVDMEQWPIENTTYKWNPDGS